MHEFSICESLVRAVIEELGKLPAAAGKPPRLLKVRVLCGCLQGIVPESLQLAYELLTRNTPVQGSVLEVESAPARGECRQCGWQGEVTVPFIVCGRCGAADVVLLSGKQMHLTSLEVEE